MKSSGGKEKDEKDKKEEKAEVFQKEKEEEKETIKTSTKQLSSPLLVKISVLRVA